MIPNDQISVWLRLLHDFFLSPIYDRRSLINAIKKKLGDFFFQKKKLARSNTLFFDLLPIIAILISIILRVFANILIIDGNIIIMLEYARVKWILFGAISSMVILQIIHLRATVIRARHAPFVSALTSRER